MIMNRDALTERLKTLEAAQARGAEVVRSLTAELERQVATLNTCNGAAAETAYWLAQLDAEDEADAPKLPLKAKANGEATAEQTH